MSIAKGTKITCPGCGDLITVTVQNIGGGDIFSEALFDTEAGQKVADNEVAVCKKCGVFWVKNDSGHLEIHTEHGWQS